MTAGKISTGVKAMKLASRLSLSKAPITLTPSALERVKALMLAKPEMLGLRIGVKQRGCSGLTYTLDYANEQKKFDEAVQVNGVKIFIDAKAQLTLLGTEMDFEKTELSSEFIFKNPNIKSICGCGESFNI